MLCKSDPQVCVYTRNDGDVRTNPEDMRLETAAAAGVRSESFTAVDELHRRATHVERKLHQHLNRITRPQTYFRHLNTFGQCQILGSNEIFFIILSSVKCNHINNKNIKNCVCATRSGINSPNLWRSWSELIHCTLQHETHYETYGIDAFSILWWLNLFLFISWGQLTCPLINASGHHGFPLVGVPAASLMPEIMPPKFSPDAEIWRAWRPLYAEK